MHPDPPGDVVEGTVTGVLAAVGARRPDHPALVHPGGILTYADLDAAVTGLATALDPTPRRATALAGLGVRPVLAGHGPEGVVAMLAVARSGGAFLVLDPADPEPFLAGAVARHGDGGIVTDALRADLARRIAPGRHRTVVGDAAADPDPGDPDPQPTDPVAVTYTSGSAGTPKAVVHSHRTVVANATRYAGAVGATPDDVFLVTGPLSAVAAGTPLFAALTSGATAALWHLASAGARGLPAFAAQVGATIVHVPPAALDALAAVGTPLPDVRLVSLGGDRLTDAQVAAARRAFPAATLLHRYSTSETHWIAGAEVTGAHVPSRLTPVPWLDVRVVDDAGAPVPVGDVGEVTVAGDHLALGYLDDPARTADRFVGTGSTRTYRTGDRAVRHADGTLELVGRADDVRKVRGVLVDLAAVGAVARSAPGVTDAVAVTRMRDGHTELVVVAVGADPASVRAHVAAHLPTAMVPAGVVVVAALPRTARGKVDHAAVTELATDGSGTDPATAPRDATERTVAALFAEVLRCDRVGRDADLFALGADSLAVIELREALRTHFGREVSLPDLVAHATPARLADRLRPDAATTTPGDAPLLPVRTGAPDTATVVLFGGGGGGHLDALARLAHHLGDRTVLAAVPHGLADPRHPDRTVGAMADRVVPDVLALRSGPLVLAGHSSGGTVALETARRLRAAGRSVDLVVLLDTLPITPEVVSRRRFVPALRLALRRAQRRQAAAGHAPSRRATLRAALGYSVSRLRTRLRVATVTWRRPRDEGAVHRTLDAVMKRALMLRTEPPYPGAVHLVRANDLPDTDLPADARWGSIGLGSLTVDRIPVEHDAMLSAARVGLTAFAVDRAIGRVEGRD